MVQCWKASAEDEVDNLVAVAVAAAAVAADWAFAVVAQLRGDHRFGIPDELDCVDDVEAAPLDCPVDSRARAPAAEAPLGLELAAEAWATIVARGSPCCYAPTPALSYCSLLKHQIYCLIQFRTCY